MRTIPFALTRAASIALALLSATAEARIIETSTIENTYRYNVGGESGFGSNDGGDVGVARSVVTPQGVSEMALGLTGTLEDGSFLFLHDGLCVGSCSVTLTTDITFNLFNDGDTPVDLRFDSQITPGHLANSLFDPIGQSQANFQFSVGQDPGLRQGILYTADGTATSSPPVVSTSDGSTFNGLRINDNAPLWTVADWSATNLSVDLATLGAGRSTNLYYRSVLTLSTFQTDCQNPTRCESFQVAFGDPRNAGGVINNLSTFAANTIAASTLADGLGSLSDTSPIPAVGAGFDPFRVTYRFVPQGESLPGLPPVIGPIGYDINYRGPVSGAIPEPGTWLMLIAGFGFLGAAMRRRRMGAAHKTRAGLAS